MESYCRVLNQVFDIEKKMNKMGVDNISRNLERIKAEFENLGFVINDPTGTVYDERRTDYEANITGEGKGKMKVVEVIKPIIYQNIEGNVTLAQRGVVIVE